ncbi:MAG TPA: acyltransferase family protein [Proteobacteria bacterium]|nr:acyltransferase family protein [Pseudomonadota bacterium]
MTKKERQLAMNIARKLLSPKELERVMSIPIKANQFGFDPFGLERESAILAYIAAKFLYEQWFRVESRGHENIPKEGSAIIAANHSGVIPIDGAMIAVDIVKKLDPPRLVRMVVDYFAAYLPFINTMFARSGQIIGHRKNFQMLLEQGELIGVFPEGHKGTGKLFKERYQLRTFNVGFVELSLQQKVPIIPTAVVGAEEQAPMLANLKPLAKLLGFPYFPITLTFPWLGPLGMIPFPTKYYIAYGEPFRFYEEYPPEAVDEPETMRNLADKVQLRVQEMLNEMLKKRRSIFSFGESPRALSAGGRRRRRRMLESQPKSRG